MSIISNSSIKRMSFTRLDPFLFQLQKRFKKKKVPKVTNSMRALEYFDIAYPPVYGTRWPSIRLALLSKPKYLSVVNRFADYEKTLDRFEELGAMDIRPRYEDGAEQLKARMDKIRKHRAANASEEEIEMNKSDIPEMIRPSLIQLDDDEIAARATKKEIGRYPEEYKRRVLGPDAALLDEEGLDFSNRVIKASVGGNEEALIMDYVPPSKLKGLEDWVEETDVFREAQQDDASIGLKKEIQEESLELPHTLKIYSFLKGDISDFPHPKNDGVLGVLDHYPINGASLLPVLALDIKPGEELLDVCAAPGGKSLIALQTQYLSKATLNEVKLGRVNRLVTVLDQYLPKSLPIRNTLNITMENGCILPDKDAYDKVLVDVPCLTDRHSVLEDDNNIFAPMRVKERLKMSEVQSHLLVSALQAVRPGGTVVYSTCTLSPLQNDGVVHLALSKIWQETTIECSVVDLSYAVEPFNFLYRFGRNLGLRYGQIVLPSLLNNFGPMYFSKIRRLK